jgi:glycosyltransferase involved in cell wall biosynthesis
VLFFARGAASAELPLLARELLLHEHNLETTAVLFDRPAELRGHTLPPGVLVLNEFPRPDVLRPSALRLLALGLSSSSVLVVTDVAEVLAGTRSAGTPSYFLVLDDAEFSPEPLAARVAELANRVIFGSRELFRSAVREPHPTNVAVRLHDGLGSGAPGSRRPTAERFARSLLELAGRDFGIDAATRPRARRLGHQSSRRIIVPSADWSVSGVNSALEAIGKELQRLGWEIEVLFTRDKGAVDQSAGPEKRLPDLPYRFLKRSAPGAESMWEALIADVQRRAPCTMFMGYDFIANSVAPALTEDVGTVMWLQADDGDYYEQAYRLGRYCNAVVCVSEHIHDSVAELHPVIGSRSHVIRNSSISQREVAETRPPRSDRIRIIYTGRLVQYQKRILDFVDLADALDRRGLPYEISLIGTFPVHDEAASLFHEHAARHLTAGTIRLLGRLRRERILEELRNNDFFVLLSDFEGLPLSLGEAMAAGCVPVVADMKSGIPEMLTSGKNGLIVSGRDYQRWAGEIVDLWKDPAALVAMSQSARATVSERFTVEHVAKQFDELFQRVADEIAGGYVRPPSLHWGDKRSGTGDVLPPPTMYRSVPIAGLG